LTHQTFILIGATVAHQFPPITVLCQDLRDSLSQQFMIELGIFKPKSHLSPFVTKKSPTQLGVDGDGGVYVKVKNA
jgi:hypothetical protein